jgi:hypothetical protein
MFLEVGEAKCANPISNDFGYIQKATGGKQEKIINMTHFYYHHVIAWVEKRSA